MNYDELLTDLFTAYYDCRKNKRKTNNQLQFEIDYETNLIKLADEIYNGTYEVGKSIAFIVDKPVKREIFAGSFRDRVVHHYIINKLNHIFEKQFIYDSYSCRVGKGTLFGVKRLQRAIRSCSDNYKVNSEGREGALGYKKDCYVLKLDISGYFMSIDKDILWEKIKKILCCHYLAGPDNLEIKQSQLTVYSCQARVGQEINSRILQEKQNELKILISIIKKIIYNNPTQNCIIKGKRTDWQGLPKSKSLFFANQNCGLPIGNLTSQVFSNIYLSDFDKFVQNDLSPDFKKSGLLQKTKLFYGRYVDDFYIVYHDKEYLKSLIPQIKNYLQTNLGLTLHPNKIHLQYYIKGVLFLGTFIKPYRTYPCKRLKGNFYNKIELLNREIKANQGVLNTPGLKNKFLSIINSYRGFLKHHKSYKLKKKYLLYRLSPYFWNYFYISGGYSKIKLKRKIVK